MNVEKTRVVFNAGETVASLALANSEKEPVLVQAWTDEGDPTAPPDEVQTPIIATPPVFKMQPGEVRNVKLVVSHNHDLPADRESLYWLNIFQIPPNTQRTNDNEQRVLLPLKIRLKVFVRPQGIGRLTQSDAEKLKFTLINQEKEKTLRIENPTPWHMSLSRVESGQMHTENRVVKPFSSETISLSADAALSNNVNYTVINDDGFNWSLEQTLITAYKGSE